jgi:Flp pilus assembly protein TadG
VTRSNRLAGAAARRRGQATVEFALCVIILLGTVLGLFDIGRAVLAQWSISEMAWAGGRYASRSVSTDDGITPTSDSSDSQSLGGGTSTVDIVAAARAASFLLDPYAPTVTVEYPDGQAQAGRRVRIAIDYAYEPVSSQFIGGRTIHLSSANTLLILR